MHRKGDQLELNHEEEMAEGEQMLAGQGDAQNEGGDEEDEGEFSES